MEDSYTREKDHVLRSQHNDAPRSHHTRDNGAQYRPGYEPSAPPYLEQQQRLHENLDDEFPTPREPFLGPADPHETLGWYLFNRTMRPVWRVSHTVLRVDLRSSLQYHAPPAGRAKGRGYGSAPAGTVASSGGRDYYDEEENASRGWLNGISGGGARLKIMQVWDAPHYHQWESAHRWNLSVGIGINVELDKGHLQPKLRVKANHVALHLFPKPELELRAKWPLGDTRLAMNVKYRIPLSMSLEEIWSSRARLMVNLFSPLGSGFHLTPGGVEFDEHLVQLGEHTKLRFAAAVEFPRKLPLEEGEQPVRVQVHRFGLKTVIQSDHLRRELEELPSDRCTIEIAVQYVFYRH